MHKRGLSWTLHHSYKKSHTIHNTMKLLLSTALLTLASIAFANDCDECKQIMLVSEAGIEDEYPRYTGTWIREGMWNEKAFFMCPDDCQKLLDKLVSIAS